METNNSLQGLRESLIGIDPVDIQQEAPIITSETTIDSLSNSTPKFFKRFKFHILLMLIFCFGFLSTILWQTNTNISLEPLSDFLLTIDFDIFVYFSLALITFTAVFCVTLILVLIFRKNGKPIYKRSIMSIALSLFITLLVIASLFLATYVLKHPTLQDQYPAEESHLQHFGKKVEIEFNIPVRTNSLKESITPLVNGRWEWEPYFGISGLTRRGTFTFYETLLPEQRMVAYVAGVNKVTDKTEHEYGVTFWSINDAQIVSSSPMNDEKDVKRETSIVLHTNTPNVRNFEWSIAAEPTFEYDLDVIDDSTLEIIPKQLLLQSQTYMLKINERPVRRDLLQDEIIEFGETQELYTITFETVKEPLLEAFEPTGTSVLSSATIKGTFAVHVNKESVETRFAIEPAVEGTLNWLDERTFEFLPKDPLPKATTYTVTIGDGVQTLNGGMLENSIILQFATLGEVKIIDQSIGYGTSGISEYSEFVGAFNQEVDHQSAESAFSITPGIAGIFRWSENTFSFVPSQPLALGTTYTIRLAPGIKSIHGLDSTTEFATYFTTRLLITVLDTPMYYQQNKFTCNINTALMGLAWKGFYSNEQAIISEIGYNDGRQNDQWIGNPYYEYVGTSNGSWGYGAYWPAIQAVFSNRGIGTAGYDNFSIVSLAKEIEAGHPVIIWRYNGVGGGQNISWTAADGTYVYAFSGMHGAVANGFIGNSDNPTSIHINDPWLGPMWLDVNTFDYYWGFSGRMALVIY